MFFGHDKKLLYPIEDATDTEEYIDLLDRVIDVIDSALGTMDTTVTYITEDEDMDKKIAAVLELDRVLMEYQDLLKEEFIG